jgi:RNA polymerase sigma factor (sigma-70 family)
VDKRNVLAELAEVVNLALNRIRPQWAKAVRQYWFEDLTFSEIGRREGCTPERVRQILARAYESLRLQILKMDLSARDLVSA